MHIYIMNLVSVLIGANIGEFTPLTAPKQYGSWEGWIIYLPCSLFTLWCERPWDYLLLYILAKMYTQPGKGKFATMVLISDSSTANIWSVDLDYISQYKRHFIDISYKCIKKSAKRKKKVGIVQGKITTFNKESCMFCISREAFLWPPSAFFGHPVQLSKNELSCLREKSRVNKFNLEDSVFC